MFITGDPGSGNITTQLVIIALLTLVNAFLAASELAILSANPNRINILAEKGNKKAKLVQALKDNETKFLSTIQVGITLAGFFSSATAAVSLSEGLADTFIKLDVPMASELALIIVTLILSYFTLVFGELFPKRIALRSPEAIAMAFARPVNAIRIIFKPIVFLLSGSCELLVRIFRLKPKNDDKITEEEVKALISTCVTDGTLDIDDKEIIDGVFTFRELSVRDVMTPRVDVFMINIDDSINKILRELKREKYTRVPVYRETKDNVIGILNVKDILWSLNKNYNNSDLESILRKPHYVSESMKADNLFKELQSTKDHSAIVIDESGSISGYVTMEDLIEEVMGNIYDEYDDVEALISKVDNDTYIIDGSLSIQDINKELDLEIDKDSEQYTTIAGLITYTMQVIPNVYDEVVIRSFDIKLKVLEIENNRITKVSLTKLNKEIEE
ncbi:MAG: HlyC/CorC family transporter [Acholeplasmatales bacterium]|nr:HlyC/CorC family transporter [Acholeplasmatales bacterium]